MKWVQLCSSLNILWHCLSLGLEWKWTFASPVATAEFSKFAIECSTSTASSFRIWNSTIEIPSLQGALFIVKLPKAHLTSHSRMSCSRWMIIPSWLYGSWRSFLYSSSVYSCHLFLISSASSVYNMGDLGSVPGSSPWVGKFPGEGNGNLLQYTCLENPMDRGAWFPWGRKELDTTEWLHFHFHFLCILATSS